MVFIGKSKTPRGSSKQLWEQLRIKTFYNRSAWMNNIIFMQLLNHFDSTLNEVTVLLLDIFCGHAISDEVKFRFLIVLFLPQNSSDIYQQLDGGNIAALKLKYHHYLMECVFQEVQMERFSFGVITVVKLAEWIKRALDNL
jgi:DDE superfamily endonuclease